MLINILFLFIVVSILYLASLVYYKNPKAQDNKLFATFSILLTFWVIFNFLENEPYPEQARILFLYADFISAFFVSYFWFLFCYGYLEDRRLSGIKNTTLLLALFLLMLSFFFGYVINNIDATKSILKFDFGPLYYAYALLILFCMVGGPIILIKKYFRFKGVKKIQTLYVIFGFLISASIVTVVNLFFQEKLTVDAFRIGTAGIVILIGFTSYSIVRYRLFDIRTVVQRGVIYSGLAFVIIGFYLILVYILGLIFQRTTQATMLFSAGLTSIVGIFSALPLERYFRKITDKIFFKDKYDYKDAIFSLSEIINKNISLDGLLKEFSLKLKDVLRANFIRIVLPELNKTFSEHGEFKETSRNFSPKLFAILASEFPGVIIVNSIDPKIVSAKNNKNKRSAALKIIKEEAKKEEIAAYVPVLIDDKLIAIILIGEKKSGDIYSDDDINLLQTISNQAAVAIEKAQLYDQVKNYSMELEKKVEERTSKIKGLQEEQKQMMLEIAHGLQTPLSILKAELNTLNTIDLEKTKIIGFEKAIDRISNFIYDMLRLSKLDSDIKKLSLKELNFSELLLELIESFEIITQDKGIELKTKIEKDIMIKGDRRRLEELIINFVSNSVKYMQPKGKKEIEINLKKSNEKVELIISDTGIGIEKKHINKLFTKFYRANNHGQRKPGTGLGLAICKQIIEMHKAKVKVESKAGKGTSFNIAFPLKND